MSPFPATNASTIDAPPVQSAPLDSTRLFIAAESYRGGLAPIRFGSPRDLARYQERTGIGIPAWDAIDVALREGCPEVYLCRVFGDTPVGASHSFLGTSGGASVKVTAAELGEFGNGPGGYQGEMTSPGGGSNRQITITYGGDVVASSPVVTTRAGFLAWNATQTAFVVTLGAENTLPIVAAAANFTGGTADSGTIDTDSVSAALARADRDNFGPGQVCAPGRGTADTNEALLQHCHDMTHRTALLEITDGSLVADIVTLAGTLRALGVGAEGLPRLGGAWAQDAVGPGVTPGTTRQVPWTVVQAGLIARLQAQEGHPNVAPFADFGVPRWATSASRYFAAADVETLFEAGVNVVTELFDAPRNGSFRTLEAEDASEWVDLAHTRLDRDICANCLVIGRNMGARVINRNTIQEFGGRVRTYMDQLWKKGATFGDTPGLASRVDVDSVNDTESIAAREVNVQIGARYSEHAEQVSIINVKVPIGQGV